MTTENLTPPTAPAQMPPFARGDAENLLVMVNRAPLKNMEEAGAVALSIHKFQQYVDAMWPK